MNKCSICGQKVDSSSFVRVSDGSRYHKVCFQKMLVDKGGLCPVCNTLMEVSETLYGDGENWYHLKCYETLQREKSAKNNTKKK